MSFPWECPRCRVIHAPHVDRCDCPPPTATATLGASRVCPDCVRVHPWGTACLEQGGSYTIRVSWKDGVLHDHNGRPVSHTPCFEVVDGTPIPPSVYATHDPIATKWPASFGDRLRDRVSGRGPRVA